MGTVADRGAWAVAPRGETIDEEREGGRCPECRRGVELWTCSECGLSSWQIDCAHRRGRAWLRRGRSDGSARGRIFCGECADVLEPAAAAAAAKAATATATATATTALPS